MTEAVITKPRTRADLIGKNIVVYDLEIKNPIEKCKKGWNGFDEMGISVGCAFDYKTLRYRVFMDDNIADLVARLNEPGTLVVAFNHISFDNRLLRGQGLPLVADEKLRNYDMMLVSKRGAGSSNDGRHAGFRLDDHLKNCGLPMKTANGAMAPIWYQEGKIGTVVDYCLADVSQERALFEHMWITGQTACEWKKTPYAIELPELEVPA